MPSAPAKPLRCSSKVFVVGLNQKIRDVVVTREFLNSYFGASQRFTVHKSTKEQLDKHGYNHFVFIHGVRTSGKALLFVCLRVFYFLLKYVRSRRIPPLKYLLPLENLVSLPYLRKNSGRRTTVIESLCVSGQVLQGGNTWGCTKRQNFPLGPRQR